MLQVLVPIILEVYFCQSFWQCSAAYTACFWPLKSALRAKTQRVALQAWGDVAWGQALQRPCDGSARGSPRHNWWMLQHCLGVPKGRFRSNNTNSSLWEHPSSFSTAYCCMFIPPSSWVLAEDGEGGNGVSWCVLATCS